MSSRDDSLTVRPKKLSTAFWNANREALTKPSHVLHNEANEQFSKIIERECLDQGLAPHADVHSSGALK